MAIYPSLCRCLIGFVWFAALLSVISVQATVFVFTGQPTHSGQEYLIAAWNFNDADELPESQFRVSHGIGTMETNWEGATLSNFAGTTINSFDSDSAGQDLGLRNGSELLNEGRHLTFQVSIDGFEKLILSYATRRSASGFKDQHWFWSLDGENFVFHETVEPSSNYKLETVSFESIGSLAGASEVYLRVVFEGIPEQASPTGNNRLDNVQIRAVASEGTAGPGFSTLKNLTSGSPYYESDLFLPGEEQVVELAIHGSVDGKIVQVSVELPAGWIGLSAENLELSGEGFIGAKAVLNEDRIEIRDAQISEKRSGMIRISGLKTGAIEEFSGWEQAFTVRTAFFGEEPALLDPLPMAIFVLPVGEIRDRSIKAGQRVAVSGTATVSSGLLSATEFWSFIQDDRAGIAIYADSLFDFWMPVFEGNRYTVAGEIESYRGSFRLRISDASELFERGEDSIPDAKIRTIAELLANPDAMNGMLVRVPRVSLGDGSDLWPEPGESGTISVTDDGGETVLDIFLNRFTDVAYQAEPQFPVDFLGIFSRFAPSGPASGGYWLIPRSREDILPAEILNEYSAWLEKYFSEEERLHSGQADPESDPDGDGVVNLLEYAFGGDPRQSDRTVLPEISEKDGRIEIVFRRNGSADDLIYEVEGSEDLLKWQKIWSSDDFPYHSALDYLEERVVDEREFSESSSGRFLRVRVIREKFGSP